MNRFLTRIDNGVSHRLLNGMDAIIDLRICGESLVEYVPSIDRNDAQGIGGTGSQSTHYVLLKHIFSHVKLTSDDVFLDVGCGKGRVLAFLIKEKCSCHLCGVEHNTQVARQAERWIRRYPQAQIIIGDAFALDFNDYTVLSLARSFLPKTFLTFVERLEATITHPITLIYWYDQQSGHLLKDRPGWEMRFREKIDRLYGLKIASVPQSYSIWTYDPGKSMMKDDGNA